MWQNSIRTESKSSYQASGNLLWGVMGFSIWPNFSRGGAQLLWSASKNKIAHVKFCIISPIVSIFISYFNSIKFKLDEHPLKLFILWPIAVPFFVPRPTTVANRANRRCHHLGLQLDYVARKQKCCWHECALQCTAVAPYSIRGHGRVGQRCAQSYSVAKPFWAAHGVLHRTQKSAWTAKRVRLPVSWIWMNVVVVNINCACQKHWSVYHLHGLISGQNPERAEVNALE